MVQSPKDTRLEKSLIDHNYTNNDKYSALQIYSDLSDHEFIVAHSPCNRLPTCVIKIRVRDWRHYDKSKLEKTIQKNNFTLTSTNYAQIMQLTLKKVAPYRVIRVKNTPGQLVHPKLEKKKKRRDRQLKLFRQTGIEEFLKETRKLSKEIKK